MSKTRSFMGAGAVLAVALAAGHLVQTISDSNREAAAKTAAAAALEKPVRLEPVSAGATDVQSAPRAGAKPAPALALASPAAQATPTLPTAPLPTATLPTAAVMAAQPAAGNCKPQMDLTPAAQQMIVVSLTAPCQAGLPVVLRHGGLVFAEKLDALGHLQLQLPALEVAGRVSALFEDASSATAAVAMPGVARIDRFVLQSMAEDRFTLHAMENGAAYGEAGYISAARPLSASGGFIQALGDPDLELPMLAEVYTWPADGKTRAHPVVEAQVSELTCGRELRAETLLLSGGVLVQNELTLAMPDCDAVGDILVLNNLVPDMTLAAAD